MVGGGALTIAGGGLVVRGGAATDEVVGLMLAVGVSSVKGLTCWTWFPVSGFMITRTSRAICVAASRPKMPRASAVARLRSALRMVDG
jgi:hypothetical protein